MRQQAEALTAACDQLDAALDTLLGSPIDALTHAELLAVDARLERAVSRIPTVRHRLIARLAAEASPTASGGTSLTDVLATRLRISKVEARRRITHAELLGPRQAPHRRAAGAGMAEDGRRPSSRADRRRSARSSGSSTSCPSASRSMWPSRPKPSWPSSPAGWVAAATRARRGYLNLGRQQADGMTPITGLLDPETAATLEPIFAKWAALGMCNPDDPQPCVDAIADAATKARDTRSPGQRNRDALKAMGRSVLASGRLGQHGGLPCTIIVSTTRQDLKSAAGHAVTAGRTRLPMRDVIRLASHSHHYLYIFDKHTQEPLYLGRSKRLASAAQRIVLLATDRGCTFPGLHHTRLRHPGPPRRRRLEKQRTNQHH